MVSAKEKREFNERMIKMALRSGQVSQIQQQQHEFLLRDTNGGKLYKYRAFDPNGYALESLKNGTLHCSKPDDFNDPFDCKIGVTFKSLFEEKFGDKHDALVEILEKFMLIMHGEMELQVCNVVEQRIIRELLSDQKVMQFITDNQNLVQTEEQMVEKLKGSMSPIIEIMQTILRDEEFEENLGSCTKKLPHIMKNTNLGKR